METRSLRLPHRERYHTRRLQLSDTLHQIFVPDVCHLGLEFYMLHSSKSAESKLSRLADQILYYERYLDQYPSVMVQGLEPLYQLARGIAAFDTNFLALQLNEVGGWRGIISGGLYCLLAGAADLIEQLRAVCPTRHPEHMWSCECAVAYLTDSSWPPEHRGLESPLKVIRNAVLRLSFPETPLRRSLTADEIVEFEQFRMNLRQQYRNAGVATARTWMRLQPQYHWIVSHREWIHEFAVQADCPSRYHRHVGGLA
jgi:hypothetical protein